MNYQFFGTAGICSGVLLVATVVFFILYGVGCDYWWYYKTTNLMRIIGLSCFLLTVTFWLVLGILCVLDYLWGWELVR